VQLQIVRCVVGWIAIAMMNDFGREQRASEDVFHDGSVLADLASTGSVDQVPVGPIAALTVPASLVFRGIAVLQ
jgi:hypothetical protein